MKNYSVLIVIITAFCFQFNLQATSPEIETARNYGAEGKVTFRVVDSKGDVVPDANIKAGFYNPRKGDGVCAGQSDSNGLFIASGNSVDDMNYSIIKNGYYKTQGRYVFYRRTENPVINGRWQPWNPTNTVVLKELRKPVPMYAKHVDAPVPLRDVPVGFDLEVGDWVVPHGKGKKSDMFFTDKAKIQDAWTGYVELSIACSNQLDGFYRTKKDMWSEFKSAYDAPLTGYQTTLQCVWETTKDRDIKDERVGEKEYIIFRVRTVVDDKNNVVGAQYGKIYGPLEFAVGKEHHIRFTYYFNPTPNDRNLEFDTSRNLIANPGSMRVYMP